MGKVGTEATLLRIEKAVDILVREQTNTFENYSDIKEIVQQGLADKVFRIGDQIITKWSDGTNEYDLPWDVVDIADVVNANGDTVPGLWLQAHWALPGVQFDASEAIYYAESGLPAGTYHFSFGETWGTNVVSGKSYQFALTQAVPAGGQIVVGTASSIYTWGAPDQNPSNWRVYTFSDFSSVTPIETVTPVEGTDGTDLGTMTSNIKYASSGINNLQRCGYGYNRWSQSAMRQWLNSSAAAGAWQSAQNVYDRPAQQLATMRGFMAGLSEEFVAVIDPVQVVTALNTKSDSDIGTTETTLDRFFLASLEQEYCVPQLAGVEGSYWPYWKERLELDAPQAWYQAGTNANHIRYLISNHSSAQNCRLRSASRGRAYDTWRVLTSGNVDGYGGAAAALPGVPACVIC